MPFFFFLIQRKKAVSGNRRKTKQLLGKLLVISSDEKCQCSNALCFSDCSLQTRVFLSLAVVTYIFLYKSSDIR